MESRRERPMHPLVRPKRPLLSGAHPDGISTTTIKMIALMRKFCIAGLLWTIGGAMNVAYSTENPAPEIAEPADSSTTQANQSSGATKIQRLYQSSSQPIQSEWLAAIESAENFEDLGIVQEKYRESRQESSQISLALEEKWKEVTAGMAPQNLVKGIDFLTVLTQATGENEYTFSFLLRSTEDIGEEYHLGIGGKVDRLHRQNLPPDRREAGWDSWAIVLKEKPTTTWRANEFHLLKKTVKTPMIPYYLSISLEKRDTSTPSNKLIQLVGKKLVLGWQGAVQD